MATEVPQQSPQHRPHYPRQVSAQHLLISELELASPPVVVRLFALGSWGADPSFGAKLDGRYRYQDKIDRSAQVEVASSMAFAAREGPPPQLIVTQGNNFNWYGLLPPSNQERSVQARVNETFTSKYNQLSLAAVPWTAIMGEHDVGGGRFLCGSTEATLHACGNENELIAGLRHKIASQRSEPPSGGRALAIRGTQNMQHAKPKKIQHSHDEGAVSTGTIQDPRWTMKDQYYKQRLVSKDGQVTVDVFHVNVLVGSARSICCQCIGYAHPTRAATACTSISARDDYCAGGNYAFYKACSGELRAMADASYTKFKADVAVSNATFKIVNGHVSPWAMDSSDRLKWIDATAQGRVHLWLHATNPTMTHVEALPSARRLKERHTKRISKHSKHVDHVKGSDAESNGDDGFASHFMTNGVGGGIPIQVLDGAQAANQESAKVVWTLDERKYGFLDILATATSLRVLLRATGNTVLYCVDIDRDTGDDVKCKLE
ncbi:hypothetical protein, variant [Aphanomyces invadans]|uniref:Calcineurin-like phosphoesterase domain-containing protein n=1 Tax=Aphanomyces invadans TaxID=157072 RepID=A0A024UEV2_9STRA|nr:hypothetical protein, variant [Aphanomyces invadans]ETW04387.1 hypothetical protein, variant [Aphanomyces invadans]|eukprot:XP_008867343.1 hypothetical protein, variant [Aphanomyces invadans]